MTTYVKFDVHQDMWSTGGYDPEDSWSRDSTDGTVSIRFARKVKEDGYDVLAIDQVAESGTVVHLVWAQYSTGDSFGHDGGQYELLEVCLTREIAEDRQKHYVGVTDYSVPWIGYFERLYFVQVDSFVLM